MRNKYFYPSLVLFAGLLLCLKPAEAQNAPIDTALALQYFNEAQAACDRDGGRLWGINICGPILFADPLTRQVVTNQSDTQGLLTRKGEVFLGTLPVNLPIANAPISWAGKKWAMIIWSSLTDDKFQRVRLMVHESYHRVQNELKFAPSFASNDHLDTMEGRIWLQLEWRALQKALKSKGSERRRAIEDALTFRSYRRIMFADSNVSERVLEMNEGLAEYTGFKIASSNNEEFIDYLIKKIDRGTQTPSFVGSFAYSSGPAYGILLDESAAGWLKGLTPQNDLGELLQKSLRLKLKSDLKARAEKQAGKYGGAALRLAETEREAKRQQQIADYRKRLVEGPVLLITLTDKRSVTINSSSIVPLKGVGRVYPTVRITDEWGILEVSNGALTVSDERGRISKVYVSVAGDLNARPLKGDGWTLQINSGWSLAPGQRAGDYVLKKSE